MKTRFVRAVSTALVVGSLLLSQTAFAAPRDDDPFRDGPIAKIVKVIKKIFHPTPSEDYPGPPKP